jgi:hypothetical protein
VKCVWCNEAEATGRLELKAPTKAHPAGEYMDLCDEHRETVERQLKMAPEWQSYLNNMKEALRNGA